MLLSCYFVDATKYFKHFKLDLLAIESNWDVKNMMITKLFIDIFEDSSSPDLVKKVQASGVTNMNKNFLQENLNDFCSLNNEDSKIFKNLISGLDAALICLKYTSGTFSNNNSFAITITNLLLNNFITGFGRNFPKQPYQQTASCPNPPLRCTKDIYFYRDTDNPVLLRGAVVNGPELKFNILIDNKDNSSQEFFDYKFEDKRTNVAESSVSLYQTRLLN